MATEPKRNFDGDFVALFRRAGKMRESP